MTMTTERVGSPQGAHQRDPRGNSWPLRIMFVIILASLGALIGAVVASNIPDRYEATTLVDLAPDVDPDDLFSEGIQTEFAGENDERLTVAAGDGSLEFKGSALDPDDAVRTSVVAAQSFVAAADERILGIRGVPTTPTEPATPNRLTYVGGGIAIGALIGLILQPALRPRRRTPGVSYVPSWTQPGDDDTLGTDDQPASSFSVDQDGVWSLNQTEGHAVTVDPPEGDRSPFSKLLGDADARPSERPRPAATTPETDDTALPADELAVGPDTSTFSAAVVDQSWSVDTPDGEPRWRDDPIDQDPTDDGPTDDGPTDDGPTDDDPTDDDWVDEGSVAVVADEADASPEFDPSLDKPDVDEPDVDEPDVDPADGSAADFDDAEEDDDARMFFDSADATDELESVAEPEPSEDPDLEAEEEAAARVRRAAAAHRAAQRVEVWELPEITEPDLDDLGNAPEPLVQQLVDLSEENAAFRRRIVEERERQAAERERLTADHATELAGLRAELDRSRNAIGTTSRTADHERSRLQDRIADLEVQLNARSAELERARSAALETSRRSVINDQSSTDEIDFLRSEVERYQATLDEERIANTKAVASSRIESQDELDRIHREHRTTLNQLAQTHRNLLTSQRNDAERSLADLEASHQEALDAAHADYEERLQRTRTHQEKRLSTVSERLRAQIQGEHDAELAELREQVRRVERERELLEERLATADATLQTSDRAIAAARQDADRSIRRNTDEMARLRTRNNDLEVQLERAEKRLADERKRTSEVVRNLLQESATTAATAARARESQEHDHQAIAENLRSEIEQLRKRFRALEDTSARREADLEATIAELRSGPPAAP